MDKKSTRSEKDPLSKINLSRTNAQKLKAKESKSTLNVNVASKHTQDVEMQCCPPIHNTTVPLVLEYHVDTDKDGIPDFLDIDDDNDDVPDFLDDDSNGNGVPDYLENLSFDISTENASKKTKIRETKSRSNFDEENENDNGVAGGFMKFIDKYWTLFNDFIYRSSQSYRNLHAKRSADNNVDDHENVKEQIDLWQLFRTWFCRDVEEQNMKS